MNADTVRGEFRLNHVLKFRRLSISLPIFENELENDHGRIDRRRYWLSYQIDWLENRGDWMNLKALVHK